MNVLETDFRLGLCAVCGKNTATQFCDYITEYTNDIFFIRNRKEFNEANRRGGQYETCDLPMCKECSYVISRNHDFCPHHYSLHMKRDLPDRFQQKRRSQAKGYLAGLVIRNE